MIITKTPLRISLCGGGTDYPAWFKDNGGLVVGGAINQYSYITARYLPPYHAHKSRVVYSQIELVKENKYIEHKALRACLQLLAMDEGVEIMHAADLPGRSGTGSSSTFVVGVLRALSTLKHQGLVRPDILAEMAITVERDILKENVGWQDQVWAAHGGLNTIKFRDNEFVVNPLTLSCSQVKDLESHLMLFFTGITRTSSDVAASYAPSLGSMREQQIAMMKITDQCIESLYQCNWEKVGHWVDMGWRIKASLSDKVSSEAISHMYGVSRLNGAFGGKITGAGGGGCMLLVAPPEKQEAIRLAMTELGCVHVPFKFEFDGSQVIFYGR